LKTFRAATKDAAVGLAQAFLKLHADKYSRFEVVQGARKTASRAFSRSFFVVCALAAVEAHIKAVL
jgi:hypothetical protein